MSHVAGVNDISPPSSSSTSSPPSDTSTPSPVSPNGTASPPNNTSPPSPNSVPIPPKIMSGWTHRPSQSPRRVAKGPRLGAIKEDGGMLPDAPPRAHRPMGRLLFGNLTPTLHGSRNPPPYSEYNNLIGPNGEKFADLRKNRTIPRRGGWLRFVLIIVVLAIVAIALGVGLGVGLTRKNSSPTATPSPTSTPRPEFPIGSYSLTTFLDTVATGCTPNDATWRCYPYQTYNESTTGSQTVFNWVITSSDPSSSSSSSSSSTTSPLLISSSNNPFALTFTNATLSLVNQGTSNEAYSFSVPMEKIVVPTVALTADGSSAECVYSNTMFQASLYSRKAKTYPAGVMSGVMSQQAYGPWPYAVQIEEVIGAGSGVPECFKVNNGVRGDKVDIGTVANPRNVCMCLYQNYGP